MVENIQMLVDNRQSFLGAAIFCLNFTIVLKKSYPERQREWPIDALATHIIRSDMKVPNPSIT
jgi:hypothetical protein